MKATRPFRSPFLFPFAALCVSLLCLFSVSRVEAQKRRASGAKSAVASGVPATLQKLIEKALPAVNERNLAALAPLTDGKPETRMGWVTGRTTSHWSGDILPVPGKSKGANPLYLAVFHAWHTCESDGDHVHKIVRSGQGWRLGEEIAETETGGFRVRHHELSVSVEVPLKRVSLRDRVTLERVQESVPEFGLLRLSNDYRVQSFQQEGGTKTPFGQVGGILVFTPPATKTFTLTMQYAGTVNHTGSDYVRENEVVLNSYWYPHIARLPATSTVTATAPKGWTAIGQGEGVKEIKNAQGQTVLTFRNDIPTSYFTLDMGKYLITRRKTTAQTLSIYQLRANPELAKQSLDILEQAMAFYEKSFGKFPYSHYTLVETLGPFGGALEAYSFATYGPGTLPSTVAHELAHTWWGGVVPCAYTRSMWNESFAEYSDGLFQRKTSSAETTKPQEPEVLRQYRVGMARAARSFSSFPLTQAHDTSDPRQAAVGYGKGGLVLRVLEEELGQETMLRCIQTFLADHKPGEAAEWSDFEAGVKKTTGKDYRWFFAQWMERTGLPTLRLANVRTEKDGEVTYIEGEIVQTGTPYRLRLPLLIQMAEGEAQTEIVEVTGAKGSFRIRARGVPVRMTLDPQTTLPLAAPDATENGTDPLSFVFRK